MIVQPPFHGVADAHHVAGNSERGQVACARAARRFDSFQPDAGNAPMDVILPADQMRKLFVGNAERLLNRTSN